MPATVKRIKSNFAPPSLCSGCYWQNLTRMLREENRQLRHDLIKARAEKRAKPAQASKKLADAIHDTPEHEPIRPGHSLALDDHADADLVDLMRRGGL